LHLQLALNRPSQHHPFSRAFCSFYVMNLIEQTPQNNHDGRPKRRRLDGPSPGDTPAINRYVLTFNRSPVAASIVPNRSAENRPSDPSHEYDEDSFIELHRPPFHSRSIAPSATAAIILQRRSSHPSRRRRDWTQRAVRSQAIHYLLPSMTILRWIR
jgi:hypothetical protein